MYDLIWENPVAALNSLIWGIESEMTQHNDDGLGMFWQASTQKKKMKPK